MKTLLIPVDFTATSDETVNFAAAWSKHYEYKRVILLKTFYDNVFSNIVISAEYGAVSQDFMQNYREEATKHLEMLAQKITSQGGDDIKVVIAMSEEPLLRAVMEIIHGESPEMVMLGSDHTNDTADGGGLISRNIISIAKISPVRVMVVPAGYSYQPVKNALVPADFNALQALDKLNKLKASPVWAATKLLVLNVDPKERYANPDEQFTETENNLHEYLKNFHHEIHYRNDQDIISSIINFTETNDVQLIIALPGKRSFLYALTHKSISQAIYRSAKIPVIILK